MRTRRIAATLAATIAADAHLSARPAHAGNMGFKLERSFAVVREDPANPATAFQNICLVSFPLFNGLPDIGNTAAAGDRCLAGPDTIVDSTDDACDLFTDRLVHGNSFGGTRFAGSNFDLIPGDAYIVAIAPGHLTTTFLSPHF